MIDPKTLHIGAHILVNGKRVEIESITNGSQIGYYLPDGDWAACDPCEGWVEPILITEELLTELGFETEIVYDEMSLWRKDCLVVTIIGEHKAVSFANKNHAFEICYLHDLENFVYFTTKTELIKE